MRSSVVADSDGCLYGTTCASRMHVHSLNDMLHGSSSYAWAAGRGFNLDRPLQQLALCNLRRPGSVAPRSRLVRWRGAGEVRAARQRSCMSWDSGRAAMGHICMPRCPYILTIQVGRARVNSHAPQQDSYIDDILKDQDALKFTLAPISSRFVCTARTRRPHAKSSRDGGMWSVLAGRTEVGGAAFQQDIDTDINSTPSCRTSDLHSPSSTSHVPPLSTPTRCPSSTSTRRSHQPVEAVSSITVHLL